jgi:hypothetical protein
MASSSTLLKWSRQVIAGTATEATKDKLVEHVKANTVCGMMPEKLKVAYLNVVCERRVDIT